MHRWGHVGRNWILTYLFGGAQVYPQPKHSVFSFVLGRSDCLPHLDVSGGHWDARPLRRQYYGLFNLKWQINPNIDEVVVMGRSLRSLGLHHRLLTGILTGMVTSNQVRHHQRPAIISDLDVILQCVLEIALYTRQSSKTWSFCVC
jgi:hypothetical protein